MAYVGYLEFGSGKAQKIYVGCTSRNIVLLIAKRKT